MALGKLWNALFGKRSETDSITTASVVERSAAAASNPGVASTGKAVATSKSTAPQAVADAVAAERPILKTKRKAIAGKARKEAQSSSLAIAAVTETPEVIVKRVPHPKKNAWTKLFAGRQITSILDTNLGDASRAVEVLEAIVCDAVPTPKYVAIDEFDLTSGGMTVLQFHQRVRRVGGKAVPIPGSADEGLRQLSRTLGTVDLVLMDDSKPQWQTEETRRLLDRVTHSTTLLLRRDSKNNWQAVDRGVITRSQTPQIAKAAVKVSRAA